MKRHTCTCLSFWCYTWHSLPCDFAKILFLWVMPARACDSLWSVMWEELTVSRLGVLAFGCSAWGSRKAAWSVDCFPSIREVLGLISKTQEKRKVNKERAWWCLFPGLHICRVFKEQLVPLQSGWKNTHGTDPSLSPGGAHPARPAAWSRATVSYLEQPRSQPQNMKQMSIDERFGV